MSSKPKIVVFGVSFWVDKPHALYPYWRERVDKFIEYDHIFLAAGSYSDPSVMKDNDIQIIQIGVPNTKKYSRDWSYYHVGFMTAVYHLLLNIDFDVAIHVQDSVLLNTNLTNIATEFMVRDEIFAAPKNMAEMGCYVETGLMMMKKEAVMKFATSPLRPSLSDNEVMNCEEEAFHLFKDSWWNFFPDVNTIRKRDYTITTEDGSPFELSDYEFYNLPAILTSNSASKKEVGEWLRVNTL